MTEYQERMKEWADFQDWKLIETISGRETSININGVSFAIEKSKFYEFEKEFIELVAKYRI